LEPLGCLGVRLVHQRVVAELGERVEGLKRAGATPPALPLLLRPAAPLLEVGAVEVALRLALSNVQDLQWISGAGGGVESYFSAHRRVAPRGKKERKRERSNNKKKIE